MLRPTTSSHSVISFLFSDTATTEIYTLSLHDALPIFWRRRLLRARLRAARERRHLLVRERANVALHVDLGAPQDRKSTRLNSSHTVISYAVFCLKKKRDSKHGLRLLSTPPGWPRAPCT